MPHNQADFIGAWTLDDWRIEYEDGRISRPFGENAHGYIVYSDNGIMSAAIASASRAVFEKANARNASDAEKATAFDGYFHYAGRWRIDGDDVLHDVTMALNPDMAGTLQRRQAVFSDVGMLTLSAVEATTGGVRRHVLAWRRA